MDASDPRHGTNAGASAHYRDGEEVCEACRQGDAIAGRRRRKRRAQGYVFRVQLGERNHRRLMGLREEGVTYQQIADWAGVSYRTAYGAITGGPEATVSTKTFNGISTMRPTTRVTSVGLTRRIQALIAVGYSVRRLSAEMDTSATWLREVRDGRVVGPVTFACRDRIVAAYERLHMVIPPTDTTSQRKSVNRARNDAKRNRYLHPLAWDNIDDPDENPRGITSGPRKADLDHAVVERVKAGDRLRMTTAERTAVVRQMTAAGWSQKRIEEHTGITRADRYVEAS